MSKPEAEAREKIMTAAIALIQQHGDIAKITVRDIAAKAGVGIGLINYHFQTKENLVNQCVQKMIGGVISKFEPMYQNLDMAPLDKLKYLINSTASFLAGYPGISRISIVSDLLSGKKGDNSTQTAQVYYAVVKEVCGDKKTDTELSVLLHIMISSIQVAFLRSEVTKETLGFDFYDVQQRKVLIDMIIDSIFADRY